MENAVIAAIPCSPWWFRGRHGCSGRARPGRLGHTDL